MKDHLDSAHLAAVVIVSAFAEWNVVRELFPDAPIQQSPLGEWFIAAPSAAAPALLYFHGGWGKIAAAASCQYVIDRFRPALIVNLGTCGGFAGHVARGTVILAERTVVYDIVEQMGDPNQAIADYATDIDLSWLGDAYPQPVLRTLLISGDRDLVIAEVPYLRQRFAAVAGDWESGAIAYVAARNGVRCLILRGVSDLVGSDGGEAYDGNMQVFTDASAPVMRQLLHHLPAWISLARERGATSH